MQKIVKSFGIRGQITLTPSRCDLQIGIAGNDPHTSYDLQNKNLPPAVAPKDTRSTKHKNLNRIRDMARGLLAANQIVGESRLFDLVGSLKYRGDCLRAMKQLRNFYPDKLKLVLHKGEWYLVPVSMAGE